MEGDGEFYVSLLKTFLESAQADIAEIKKGLELGAYSKLREKSHSLKGSSRNIGADAIGEICQSLEALADTRTKTGGDELLQRLENEFARVEQEICQEMAAQ